MRLHSPLLSAALLFSIGTLTGCPEKAPPKPSAEEMQLMGSEEAFNQAVLVLQSPNRDGFVDYASAFEMLEIGIKNGGSKNKNILFNAGWTAERLGKQDVAIGYYKRAFNLDKSFKNAMFNLGSIYSASGKATEAAAVYRQYLEENPKDVAVRNNLVEALVNAKAHDDAIEAIREILLIDEANTAAYRNLSQIYYDLNQYDMALLTAQKTQGLNDSDPGIYNNLGMIYLKQGDSASAISEFRKALKLDPQFVEASLNLGWVALASEDYELAKAKFTVVHQKAPEHIDGILGLAIAYRGHKEYDKAAKLYELAISIDAQNDVAYENAAILHQNYTKNFKKARKYLEDWKSALVGNPSYGLEHPVHDMLSNVDTAQKAWEAEQAEIAAQKKAEEELRKAQLAQLKDLGVRVSSYEKLIGSLCPMIEEMGMLEDLVMVADMAKESIEAEDFAMAQQLFPTLDEMETMIAEDLMPLCGDATGGGGEAAPEAAPEAPPEAAPAEEGGEEAPPEAAPEAPPEAAPAEEGE